MSSHRPEMAAGELPDWWLDDVTLTGSENNWSSPPPEVANRQPAEWLSDESIMTEIRNSLFVYGEPITVILIVLYSVTFTLGILGNACVIYVFVGHREMRTITNWFLVNLALSDLLVLCLCIPIGVAMEVYQNWLYGESVCKLVNYSQTMAVTSSILTLTTISADRFQAIRRPLRARAFMSTARIRKRVLLLIWILSAVVAMPSAFVRRERLLAEIQTLRICSCVEQWNVVELKHAYNTFLLLVLYVGPVSFISVGYLRIGVNLWRQPAAILLSGSTNFRSNLSARRKVARMLFTMAMLFALSWLPIHILSIVLDLMTSQTLSEHGISLRRLHSFFLWLAHTNSAINPICYCIMSASFKATIRYELRRCCGYVTSDRRWSHDHHFRSPSLTASTTVVMTSTTRGQCRHSTTSDEFRKLPISTRVDVV